MADLKQEQNSEGDFYILRCPKDICVEIKCK